MADRIVEHLEIKYGTQQKFDDLPVKSPDALYFITNNDTFQHKLTAGDGITIDEDTNTISATGGGSGSGRNIGDIFYTTRTDTALAGAVECNGGTYSTADYTGTGSVGELLAGGKLDYISLTDYATAISTKGYCDKIGWDGTGTTSFRVPTLTPRRYVVKAQEPTAGNNYTWYRLYNDGWVEQGKLHCQDGSVFTFPIEMSSIDYSILGLTKVGTGEVKATSTREDYKTTTSCVVYFSSRSYYGYIKVSGQSAIVSDPTERAMFQLFNGTTDEAVATVGTITAQVGENTSAITELNSHRVIDFQIPTAENDYTWYRKYADGWVEQGGAFTNVSTGGWQAALTVSLPVEMDNIYYSISWINGWNGKSADAPVVNTRTTTSFVLAQPLCYNATSPATWEIKGMAKIGE